MIQKATTSWFLNDGNGFPAKPGWPGTMVLEEWFLVDDPYLTGGWTTHLKKNISSQIGSFPIGWSGENMLFKTTT